MADASTTAPDTTTPSSNGKKKGGLFTFIKKNKTLSAVVGVGGLYFLYKMNAEKPGSGTEPEGEVNAIAGEGGALAGDQAAAEYELGRSERIAEGSRSEVETIEQEQQEERERRKEEQKRQEEQEGKEPNPSSPGTPEGGTESPGTPSAPSVNIHGKTFQGATGSHIAKTGQTEGGKKYVEYAVQFPGKVEHWQYFTATGNWRQVAGSNTGGGANKPGPGNNPKPNAPPAGGTGSGSGKNKSPAPVAVAPAKPVSAPVATAHPAAVRTANRCVSGGVGGHTAPAGYHLFCGSDGWIYRAPNS